MNNIYRQKVELLLRILPFVTDEECFAIHGGTAINLFVKDLHRLSVDIDVTYIPIEDRNTSIQRINETLATWTKSRMIYREILPGGQKVGCRSKSQAQASPSKLGAVVDL